METALRRFLIALTISFIALLTLSACDLTEPDTTGASQIRATLYDVSSWFDYKDIDSFMTRVDDDYLHNGMTRWNLRELWLDRMARYSLLTISDISISFNGDYATVQMHMLFEDAQGDLELTEPSDSGDIAYFHFNGSSWLIYGNHELSNQRSKAWQRTLGSTLKTGIPSVP